MDDITKKLIETVNRIVESEAFGSNVHPKPEPVIPRKKTPSEMTYDELEQATAFGSGLGANNTTEPYKQELRTRYGPSMKPLPAGTPAPDPPPMKIPAYLQGQTDTVRFPELHLVYGLPKPPIR